MLLYNVIINAIAISDIITQAEKNYNQGYQQAIMPNEFSSHKERVLNMGTHANLTKHQSLVYETLSEMEGPVGAYALLERLQKHKLRSPQQIYRALEKLIKLNLVHKLDSLNAFIACRKQNCAYHKNVVFMICNQCKRVDEIINERFDTALNTLIAKENFFLTGSSLELNGFCNACQKNQKDT